MTKKMSISILLAITLAVGMWAVAAPAPAHAAPECVWTLRSSNSYTYSTGYHMTISLYEYIYYQGANYCGIWYAKASITIDPEFGGGHFTPRLLDGNGAYHSGSAYRWYSQSYTQSWTGTSPYVDTRCAEGNGYLQLDSGTTKNFYTNNVCGY